MTEDVRFWLARDTASLHHELDSEAARHDLTVPAGAAALIALMRRGVGRIEAGLEAAGATAALPEWPSRRRAHLLGEGGGDPVRFSGEAEVWGGLYVLEGSRLGGRMLRRSPHLADHPFFGDADDRDFWPRFLGRLGEADARLGDRDGMARGARLAFSAFICAAEGSASQPLSVLA